MTNWRRLIKVADKGPGRTGPAEAIPPTTTRDKGGAKEGETVIRSDSEGSDASAVIAVGLRQQTTADGEEHERLLSLYHAVAAALELPAPRGPLAITAAALELPAPSLSLRSCIYTGTHQLFPTRVLAQLSRM